MVEVTTCFNCGVVAELTSVTVQTQNASISYSLCLGCSEIISDAILNYLYQLAHPHSSWEEVGVPLELHDILENMDEEVTE